MPQRDIKKHGHREKIWSRESFFVSCVFLFLVLFFLRVLRENKRMLVS